MIIMDGSRECLWNRPEEQEDVRHFDAENQEPVRTADRRSRAQDMSPTGENRRKNAISGNYRSASMDGRSPADPAPRTRRVSPHSVTEFAGESTPSTQNTRTRHASRGRQNYGHPTAVLFSPVRDVNENRNRAHSSPPYSRVRPSQPATSVHQFDGKGNLQIFLSKFTTLAEVFNWSDRERAQRLRLQLVPNAESVLWALDEDCRYSEIVAELKRRFGSEQTTFHHRQLLRTMKQRRNESLADLYSRVIRQTALAFHQIEAC